ncbi:MAG: DNA photolyase, partial [Paracoccaceae bacterium]|nr:DNA photolyase [Paracoccaceae bacterium]
MFEPSYTHALARLNAFVPKAGQTYAAKRNYDDIGNVSGLSPYIRHRIITEEDVLRACLARHSPSAAEKFIQEVYWRTYWKGWLEQRPAVWTAYQAELRGALNRVQTESGLRQAWEAACKGETGIDGFDHWARELVQTGYLHNHARMWFASIWIFTLRLPWTLGADFFLRHLLDGDPASNTLSWRWVGGLQTVGKTYLARADNIAKYTEGRFAPRGLVSFAAPLEGLPHPALSPLPRTGVIDPN